MKKEREEREKVEREQKEEQMKIKAENDIKELRLSKKMNLPKEPEQVFIHTLFTLRTSLMQPLLCLECQMELK